MTKPSYLAEVIKRFGPPHIDCFDVDSFRVWVQHGWHVHDGSATSDPAAYGATVEEAAQRLIEWLVRPGVVLVEGRCDDRCFQRYSASHDAIVARREFWRFVKEAAARRTR